MAFYTTSSLVGVDFNTTSTTQLFALGTKANGSDGTEFIYCVASSAVTAFKAVVVNGAYSVAMCSISDMLDDVGGRVGFAQVAFASSEYGWVPIAGTVYVMTTGSNTLSASGVPVCMGSAVSTGMISMVATTTNTMRGIQIVAHGSGGQTATATAAQAIISYPGPVRPSQL